MCIQTALVNQVSPQAGEHLLDVGCGTGTLTQMFVEREPTLTITGLDADPDALEQAKAKDVLTTDRVTLQQGYAQDMPFAAETFDTVVSSLFFHHLTRPQKLDALKEIRRVLKPGGRLHIADWGKPASAIQRGLFVVVQLLDGFKTTQDCVENVLPDLIDQAGFVDIEHGSLMRTPLGTIRLIQAKA